MECTEILIQDLLLACEISAVTGAAIAVVPVDLNALTVTQLRDLARGRIKGFSRMTKHQLMAVLGEPCYTGAQVGAAIARLRMLPPKLGGRQVPTTRVVA